MEKDKIVYKLGKEIVPFRIWVHQDPERCPKCYKDCGECQLALEQIPETIARVPEQWNTYFQVMARWRVLYTSPFPEGI